MSFASPKASVPGDAGVPIMFTPSPKAPVSGDAGYPIMFTPSPNGHAVPITPPAEVHGDAHLGDEDNGTVGSSAKVR